MHHDFVALSEVDEVPNRPNFCWLDSDDVRNALCKQASVHSSLSSFTDSTVDDLLCDLWAADRAISARPLVGAATLHGQILGVMEITAWQSESCDYIHVFALPTGHQHRQAIADRLLQAAFDQSVDDGYYGWIACQPADNATSFWTEHKFSRHIDGSFRRLGYFVH